MGIDSCRQYQTAHQNHKETTRDIYGAYQKKKQNIGIILFWENTKNERQQQTWKGVCGWLKQLSETLQCKYDYYQFYESST